MNEYAKVLLYTILISAVLGVLVLIFNKSYRVEEILKTNHSYYPNVE